MGNNKFHSISKIGKFYPMSSLNSGHFGTLSLLGLRMDSIKKKNKKSMEIRKFFSV